ncbi:hypothetical protein [Aeromicrobium sp. CTD01-1L150]|uniref:hypothetical protein n=1 Tax=Aeromicrobium sp. CTD01-1L150 TaxID=3341830 RepID=UPI0035C09C01
MFRLLRTTSPTEDDVVPSADEIDHVTRMLVRTQAGGAYETVLATRVGQLHARAGSSVVDALAAIDAAYADAGRPPASTHVTSTAVDAWARDVLALTTDDAGEALTGLTCAESLQAHVETDKADGEDQHVLIAEVMIDERDQRARGVLQWLEAELSLALVHAVLQRGVESRSPWARLGERRLGTAVSPCPVTAAAVSDAVTQARRWLGRWRQDLDVSAWVEPVPVEPRARGLLMKDLAM